MQIGKIPYGMHDIVDALHRHDKALLVPDVAQEVAHAGSVKDLLHLELLRESISTDTLSKNF